MVQKKHIVKIQLIVNQKYSTIRHCQVETEGSKSHFKIFQETNLKIHPKIKIKGDLGYQGIDKIHPNSKVPHKKPKTGELTKKQKSKTKYSAKKE